MHNRIWLQEDDDTTWCQDKINDDDIEYVKADINGDLIEQAESMLEFYKKLCDKINFGASFLDAEVIGLMNTVPGKLEQAILKAKED